MERTFRTLTRPLLCPLNLSILYTLLLVSHNAQLPKPFKNLLVHSAQPLFLEGLFSTHLLDDLLKMFPNERNEIDLMHRISVDEFAFADVFRCLGFGGVVRFRRPEERTKKRYQYG